MKKTYLLALALLLPMQTIAIEQDSVYAWGEWAEGIQPAAGPVAQVTPPPAKTPNVNFRPNENSAFLREASVAFRPAPDAAPGATQISNVIIGNVNTPTTPVNQF